MRNVFIVTAVDYGLMVDEKRSDLIETVLNPGSIHSTLKDAIWSIQEELNEMFTEHNEECLEDDQEKMDPIEVKLEVNHAKDNGIVDEWGMHVEEFSMIYRVYEREVK